MKCSFVQNSNNATILCSSINEQSNMYINHQYFIFFDRTYLFRVTSYLQWPQFPHLGHVEIRDSRHWCGVPEHSWGLMSLYMWYRLQAPWTASSCLWPERHMDWRSPRMQRLVIKQLAHENHTRLISHYTLLVTTCDEVSELERLF